ncbi:hypothetical protein D7Z26_06805 [Cohnella endophytica]|uniref:Uncharacterized protein n=1 Tax=Cohnella endophytica TaxID=2419778 RepID=A0A494Y0T3_9BACL|nr:hypothetical protein [Cohnella endophytica]RKP54943.1 hypothetical protein D7Z26_06805 [Cohnella endophytica]
MARINLSINDDLFELLSNDAGRHNCTVNVYLISLIEGLYLQDPFDYEAALSKLIAEAKIRPLNAEFILFDLPSFKEICIAKAENANLKPSMVRARLGKSFNKLVEKKMVGSVRRVRNEDGSLKFISSTAVFIRKAEEDLEDAMHRIDK